MKKIKKVMKRMKKKKKIFMEISHHLSKRNNSKINSKEMKSRSIMTKDPILMIQKRMRKMMMMKEI